MRLDKDRARRIIYSVYHEAHCEMLKTGLPNILEAVERAWSNPRAEDVSMETVILSVLDVFHTYFRDYALFRAATNVLTKEEMDGIHFLMKVRNDANDQRDAVTLLSLILGIPMPDKEPKH